MKIFKTKQFLAIYLSVVVLGGLFWYVNANIFRLKAEVPRVNITVAPKDGTFTANSDQHADIVIQPQDANLRVSGVDITFKFKGVGRVTAIGDAENLADPAKKGQKVKGEGGTGAVRAVFVFPAADSELPNAVKIPVTFSGRSEGTGGFDIEAQVTGNIPERVYTNGDVDGGNYSFGSEGTGGSGEGKGGSAPPAAEGRTKLTLSLRFQGITTKPKAANSMNVRVRLAGGPTNASVDRTVEFVPDDGGIYRGTVGFDAADGGGYYLLIKGPRHLQKKICVDKPSESSFGGYRCQDGQVSIAAGDKTLDLSGIRLFSGDLPVSTQDGVIDSADISYIRQNLGKTDAEVLRVADVNQDGIVDTQDYSLVIASLSAKYDEK